MIRQQKMLEMSPAQCRAARALIDWTQPALAEAAGVGLSTVVDFEKQRRAVSQMSIDAIKRALEEAGVEFTNGGQPGVRVSVSAAVSTRGTLAAAEPNAERRPKQASGKKGSGVQDGELTRRALVEKVPQSKTAKRKTRP